MVKYHPSVNTLISKEQRGGVRNKYIYYILGGMYITSFCSTDTPYVKGAELGHSHFFRSVAWEELSINIGYGTGTKNVFKRKRTL